MEIAAAVGAWGLDLVMCDVDTLWLRDPGDFFDTCAPTDAHTAAWLLGRTYALRPGGIGLQVRGRQ